MTYLRKETRSDHVTRNALAARNNEDYGQGNGLFMGCFTLELEMDYPSETSPCTVVPLPHRHPLSDFFLGEGAAVHRLSETDNPYPNCPSKLTDNVRWIVHSKLKPFHFQTYYLSDANFQTDNPSHANHPSPE